MCHLPANVLPDFMFYMKFVIFTFCLSIIIIITTTITINQSLLAISALLRKFST